MKGDISLLCDKCSSCYGVGLLVVVDKQVYIISFLFLALNKNLDCNNFAVFEKKKEWSSGPVLCCRYSSKVDSGKKLVWIDLSFYCLSTYIWK